MPETTFSEAIKSEIYQMTVFFKEDVELEISQQLPSCEFNRWYPTFVDLTAKGNTKAHGIRVMAEYCGVAMKDTVAFGDGGNDIPMLIEAGIGVAMGNASGNVKNVADYVTTSVDEDGIQNALIGLGII